MRKACFFDSPMPDPAPVRIDSLKAIAQYLDRDISTILRWARQKHLPVHHVPGGQRRAVFAFKHELDAWMLSEDSTRKPPAVVPSPAPAAPAADPFRQPSSAQRGTISVVRSRFIFLASLALLLLSMAWLLLPHSVTVAVQYQQLTNDGFQKEGTLTDGARVYFAESTPAGNHISSVAVTGGGVHTIAHGFINPQLLSLSAARGEILLSDIPMDFPGQLWMLPLHSGSPQPVGHIHAFIAALSPGGAAIAFARRRQLWLCRADGSHPRRLAVLPHRINSIAWTPDHARLRLTLRSAGRASSLLWDLDRNGSHLHPVPAGGLQFPNESLYGWWGPDGAYFLNAEQPNIMGTIWLYPHPDWPAWLHRPRPFKISLGPLSAQALAPNPVPGTLYINGQIQRDQLLRFSLRRRRFLPWQPGISAEQVDVSPDRRALVFAESPNGILMVKRLGDGSEIQLTSNAFEAQYPRWSPDGRRIAFIAHPISQPAWHVYWIAAAGGAMHRLTRTNSPEGAPTWSPHGRRLAFGELGKYGSQPGLSAAIHLLNLQSGRKTVLPGSIGLWTARWSPDGRAIAAVTLDSRKLKIYSFSSRRWRTVATDSKGINDLQWSPDSRRIDFLNLGGYIGAGLYQIDLRNHAIQRLAILNFPNNGCLSLGRGGAPIVAQHISSSEIYAVHYQLQ